MRLPREPQRGSKTLLQQHSRSVQSRLDHLDAHIQHSRGLFCVELIQIAEGKYLSVDKWQLLNCRLDLVRHLFARKRFAWNLMPVRQRYRREVAVVQFQFRVERINDLSFCPPQPSARLVQRNRCQPGAELGFGSEG